MPTLEDPKPGIRVTGIAPNQTVSVVDVRWHGTAAVELFYLRADGQPGTQLLFRDDEARLEIAAPTRRWTFNADGNLFRLVAEAYRIRLALIDPDRFEGRFREGVHQVDVSDIMRRMIKEDLRRFDGRPLFPERRAYTDVYKRPTNRL